MTYIFFLSFSTNIGLRNCWQIINCTLEFSKFYIFKCCYFSLLFLCCKNSRLYTFAVTNILVCILVSLFCLIYSMDEYSHWLKLHERCSEKCGHWGLLESNICSLKFNNKRGNIYVANVLKFLNSNILHKTTIIFSQTCLILLHN